MYGPIFTWLERGPEVEGVAIRHILCLRHNGSAIFTSIQEDTMDLVELRFVEFCIHGEEGGRYVRGETVSVH